MTSFTAETAFKASESFDLTMLWTDWPEYMVTESSAFMKELMARTNVNLTLTHVPLSDEKEKRNLLLSAGDAPDIIPLVYTGEEAPFVASQTVLPMSDCIEYMPHFRQLVKDWDLQEMIDNLRQADGKMYMLPGLQEASVPVFTTVVRKDTFDELGLSIPQTWDEMREALRKIKERYPDSQPLADGFEAGALLNYASHAWGVRGGWGFGDGIIEDESGEIVYAAATDEYKQFLEFFHSLVEEGLLDTESMTTSSTTQNSGTVAEKMASNRVFVASGNSATVNEFTRAMEETLGAGNFEVVQIPAPGGPFGQKVEPRNFWHGFMLNSSVRESEHLLATIQFLDWLYFSEDGREFVTWGVEGDTYTKDAEGNITIGDGYALKAWNLNLDAPVDLQYDLGYFSDVLVGATESRKLKESYNGQAFKDYMDAVLETRTPRDPYPAAPLNEEELEQASLLATPLKDTVETNALKFIFGDRDLSEWDAFLQELEAKSLSSYLELIRGAHQRFLDNKA